jgi:uncharacterized repeat protein (TIGR01451 family)
MRNNRLRRASLILHNDHSGLGISRSMAGYFWLMVVLALLISVGLWQAKAQETLSEATAEVTDNVEQTQDEPTATPEEPIVVLGIAPTQINAGESAILFITGNHFTPSTKVELTGVGALSVSYVGSTQLRAAIPSTLAAGAYIIQVSDSTVGGANSSFTLNIITPPAPTNPPTIAPPTVPPTDIPGAPSILVRSFRASSSSIKPGDTIDFTVNVINQGSRVAQGISVSLDAGGKFAPANGQANVILPDLGVNGTFSFSLSAVAANDTSDGPQTVGITFSYRDFTGQTYTSKGSLTVNVQAVTLSSQITLSRYMSNPNPVVPGDPVTVTVLLTNSGNETASQVLVQIGDGILLAGPQGNSFPIGDIGPGASTSKDMPLIVSNTAKAGPQSQAITISYLQKGEAKTANASMTLDVIKVDVPAPIMVLQSYSTGVDVLQPGQEFTLTMALENIGSGDAVDTLVTFGSVESSGGGIDPTPGSSSSTTTTPSTTFAPLGSGGTLSAGTIDAGGTSVTLSQDFIVNASVDSGVYSLPITLRYTRPDGSTAQDRLSASLLVIVPPQIRVTESSPFPENANVGDSLSLALEISNRGKKPVNFSTAIITTDNGDILQGAETFLGPLRNDDQTELSALVVPSAEGKATITVTLNYTDDLNRPQTIVETYEVEVAEALPPPDVGGQVPSDVGGQPALPTEESPLNGRDILGRILLGLLGLGS